MFAGGLNSLPAQCPDSPLTCGVVAYHQGDYKKALLNLDTAIELGDNLKESNIPKAWYFRGRTWLHLSAEWSRNGQNDSIVYYNSVERGCWDLEMAKNTDNEGKWSHKISAAKNWVKCDSILDK